MTRLPKGAPPGPEEFRQRAREEFGFLATEYGFREEPVPVDENPFLNRVAVWFASPTTRVVVEGTDWGLRARVALGQAGSVAAFENYDLGDLLAVRRATAAAERGGRPPAGGQLEQLRRLAEALRETGADVLCGDHSVFPQLAARVEARRAEFSRRDQRT